MKPSRINKARSRFTAVSASAAILLGLAILYGAGTASAADGRPTRTQASRADRTAMPMSPRGVIERRQLIIERRGMPEVAPGGTVVLRGRRSPATPNITPSGQSERRGVWRVEPAARHSTARRRLGPRVGLSRARLWRGNAAGRHEPLRTSP